MVGREGKGEAGRGWRVGEEFRPRASEYSGGSPAPVPCVLPPLGQGVPGQGRRRRSHTGSDSCRAGPGATSYSLLWGEDRRQHT